MPTRADALVIMAKAPISGTVKTRLVPPLTFEQAADLARALLIDHLEHLSTYQGADLYLAFTPAAALASMARLAPARWRMFAQRGSELGERMANTLAELWERGHRNVVLMGSDLPPVPLPFIAQALAFLKSDHSRVILGPARDGGYYLVGMNQPAPAIFSRMTWSTDHVLADTLEHLDRLGTEHALLPQWLDIDSGEDLEKLKTVADPGSLAAMKHTRSVLERLRRG